MFRNIMILSPAIFGISFGLYLTYYGKDIPVTISISIAIIVILGLMTIGLYVDNKDRKK